MKVCLIVDNPERDLDGLVLLARELTQLGATVFLVPMPIQAVEVPAIAPDFVLLNYARKVNRSFLQNYHQAGMSVGILDTEGGMYGSTEDFLKSVDLKSSGEFINLYCLWGRAQHQAFLESVSFPPEKLNVTGHPRFDYYSDRWSGALEKPFKGHQPYILFISNFCLGYPRFVKSTQVELDISVASGFRRDYILSRIEEDRKLRQSSIELIEKLCSDFPDISLVIRPHPFEDDREYFMRFKNRKNVIIERKGTVGPWIKHSMAVLHINSSCAVDGYLLKKNVLSLDWLAGDVSRSMIQIPQMLSKKISSYEGLKQELCEAKKSPASFLTHPKLESILQSWLHVQDGFNARRVAQAIVSNIQKKDKQTSTTECRKRVFYGGNHFVSVKSVLEVSGRIAMGPRNFTWLRTQILTKNIGRNTKKDKLFNTERVKQILDRLDKAESSTQPTQVSPVSKKDTVIGRVAGLSVKIYQAVV